MPISGIVQAVCASTKKGTAKRAIPSGLLVKDHGLENDAHAGNWHRQVSFLSLEKIEDFQKRGAKVVFGDFGENLVVSNIDFATLPVGTQLRITRGGSQKGALLEITQIGKECHSHCAIFHTMGECIMPKQGVFAKVLEGGEVAPGDTVTLLENAASAYKAAILTVSDKGARGEREDASGEAAREILEQAGYTVAFTGIVPDEQETIAAELKRLCDVEHVALVLTTGGTGFSPRDVTPEATLNVTERLCPGIPEAMRSLSLAVTNRAMLSRAVAGIRGQTLIVNLPGSPKAVRECLAFIMEPMRHGLDILTGTASECARSGK